MSPVYIMIPSYDQCQMCKCFNVINGYDYILVAKQYLKIKRMWDKEDKYLIFYTITELQTYPQYAWLT